MALRPLLSDEQIQKRILEMGAQIGVDYPAGNLFLICILKGACYFLADLSRAIKRDVFIDFMGISSYGRGKTSSGEVKITRDLDISLEGADVLIVEDIIDSGLSMREVHRYVKVDRGAKDVRTATFLDKAAARKVEFRPDYVGFSIDPKFVIGYGLDYAEKYRNIPEIQVLSD
jgi:hypoxanthine phosphoribosyltransferase